MNVDHVVYDFWAKRLNIASEYQESDNFNPLMDYFYRNQPPSNNTVKAISNMNQFEIMSKVTKGNVVRSIDATTAALSVEIDDFDPDTPEGEARLRNHLNHPETQQYIEEYLDSAEKVDAMLGAGNSSSSDIQYSPDDFLYREMILDKMKTGRAKKVMDLFGMIYNNLKHEERQRSVYDPAAQQKMTQGSDINNAIFSEYMKMAVPELELLLHLKIAQASMMQYVRESPESQQKGDIHIIVDISGSMDSELPDQNYKYSRLDLAIASCLAMVKLLTDQKRGYKVSVFNTNLTDVGSSSFAETCHEMITIASSGATNISRCLFVALQQSHAHLGYSNKVRDVFVITDCDDKFAQDGDEGGLDLLNSVLGGVAKYKRPSKNKKYSVERVKAAKEIQNNTLTGAFKVCTLMVGVRQHAALAQVSDNILVANSVDDSFSFTELVLD